MNFLWQFIVSRVDEKILPEFYNLNRRAGRVTSCYTCALLLNSLSSSSLRLLFGSSLCASLQQLLDFGLFRSGSREQQKQWLINGSPKNSTLLTRYYQLSCTNYRVFMAL